MSDATKKTGDLRYPVLSRVAGCRSGEELTESLRGLLESGMFQPGYRLPTIRELARAARMSPNVVSRALGVLAEEGWLEQQRGSGTFVRGRQDQRSERKVRSRLVGIIPPFYTGEPFGSFAGDIIHGICTQASEHRHRVEIIHHRLQEVNDFDFFDRLMEHQLDGVIWIQPYPDIPVPLVRLVDAHVPVVLTGRNYTNLPIPAAMEDMEAFGECVAEYLVRRGRQYLVGFVGRRADLHSDLRVRAIRTSLERRGLSLPDENLLTAGHDALAYGVKSGDLVERFLREHPGFDAIFGIPELAWEGVVRLQESGERVCPRDFDALHLAQGIKPVREHWPQIPFTMIRLPQDAIGRRAMQLLEGLWGETGQVDEPLDLTPWIEEPDGIVQSRPPHLEATVAE